MQSDKDGPDHRKLVVCQIVGLVIFGFMYLVGWLEIEEYLDFLPEKVGFWIFATLVSLGGCCVAYGLLLNVRIARLK